MNKVWNIGFYKFLNQIEGEKRFCRSNIIRFETLKKDIILKYSI